MIHLVCNAPHVFDLKGELHSKMTLKGMKEDLKTNISSILVFKIDSPVKRNKQLKSKSCTPWS